MLAENKNLIRHSMNAYLRKCEHRIQITFFDGILLYVQFFSRPLFWTPLSSPERNRIHNKRRTHQHRSSDICTRRNDKFSLFSRFRKKSHSHRWSAPFSDQILPQMRRQNKKLNYSMNEVLLCAIHFAFFVFTCWMAGLTGSEFEINVTHKNGPIK